MAAASVQTVEELAILSGSLAGFTEEGWESTEREGKGGKERGGISAPLS